MFPQQQQPQFQPGQQPQPAQPIQQQPFTPPTYDFTQQPGQQQAPAPVQPQFQQPDPAFTQVQTDLAEIKQAITGLGTQAPAPGQQQQQPGQGQPGQPQTGAPAKSYDEWGAVFDDTAKQAQEIVNKTLQERDQQQQQAATAATQQEQQNQQMIDSTLQQLRGANYLPPVVNQFDANDPGKQAENELLGYAISLGSTDLVRAAQELKFRHDAGFRFDHQSRQFVQVNQPGAQDPNGAMFGNLPPRPDMQPQPGQFPQQFAPQPQFQPMQQMGPQNPYMQPPVQQQYPAGFNAPVSSGTSFQGTQGNVPALRNLRANSYDALVEQFNRTQ